MNKTEELREALKRIEGNACYGIGSGDHEIMNPANYNKEMTQHIKDVKTAQKLLAIAELYEAGYRLVPGEATDEMNEALAKTFHPQMEGPSVAYLWGHIRAAVVTTSGDKLGEILGGGDE